MGVGLFGAGLSGLTANQRGLATTGHNIANANTEGYTRQRVDLGARPGHAYRNGFIGAGVDVSTVQRLLDGFTTTQIRTSTAALGEVSTFHRLAGQVDNLLADPDGGLGPAMQSFFGAVHELAADPASVPARQVLLGEAEGLSQRFHTLERRLADIGSGVEHGIEDIVGEMNALGADIAKINARIVLVEGATQGQPANDLRDQRDQLIKELSERVALTTVDQDNGATNVFLSSGQALVVGQSALTLDVATNPYDRARSEVVVGVGSASSTITGQITGGELAGVLDFRDAVLDPARRALGRIAVALAETFNTQHRLGMDLAGQPGADFFNALGGSAPLVSGHSANAGAPPADITIDVVDAGALTTSDYRLERSGATYTLTRLDDGAATTLNGFPGAPATIDGIRFDLAAGAIADGDSFLVQPTVRGAREIAVSVTGPARVAVAAPIRGEASLANTGDATIAAPVVNSPDHALTYTFTAANLFDVTDATTGATLASGVGYVSGAPVTFNGVTVDITGAPAVGDVFSSTNTVTAADPGNAGTGVMGDATVAGVDPNLSDPVTITFTGPNTYDVTGSTTGSPSTGLAYAPGQPISFNGWTMSIEGNPRAGDVFVVEPNSGGVGDNRNALALAALQTSGIVEGGTATYEEGYGRLIADVGTATRQADINRAAQEALLRQAVESREAVSGVNLDEEAANLMRYQQGYEASAQVIAAADDIFRTLIDVVAR